jgi:hypothetical protein
MSSVRTRFLAGDLLASDSLHTKELVKVYFRNTTKRGGLGFFLAGIGIGIGIGKFVCNEHKLVMHDKNYVPCSQR